MFSPKLTVSLLLALTFFGANAQHCKIMPGDAAWPSKATWDAFNKTVEGRLVRTVPVGTPCHAANFNADECSSVQTGWDDYSFHDQSSSSVMSAYYANKSCDPFSGPDSPCVIGTYVEYAVNVSTPAHIISTIKFTKAHNIRFVVRNTGHDYMGKSTGGGALSVWLHHLKTTDFIDNYKTAGYTGPALKAGAGMQVHETYTAASAKGYVVVGGDCPTVGLVGGYIQGGGHSPLSGTFGIAADQALSFEVITTDGVFTTASPTKNADLYWALSGGGGGTYAVVWSVTVKIYHDLPTSSPAITFKAGDNVTIDQWYAALEFYQAEIPKYTAAGGYIITQIERGSFNLKPAFYFNTTSEQLSTLFQPLLSYLTNSSIPYNATFTTYPTFLAAYNASDSSDWPVGWLIGTILMGGRLLGDELWSTPAKFNEMTGLVKDVLEDNVSVLDIILHPTLARARRNADDNAVLPAWRDSQRLLLTILHSEKGAPLEDVNALRQRITSWGAELTKLAPNSGSYINEADVLDPTWKQSFYGKNYDKLLQVKHKYDPSGALYGSTAVGGDLWKLNEQGALCTA